MSCEQETKVGERIPREQMGEGIDAEGIDFTPNPIYINPKKYRGSTLVPTPYKRNLQRGVALPKKL
jgi:hypothetical protein